MEHTVFVNRTINLKRIKYIGLDMDHTLIRYHTKRFETLVYQFVIDYLIEHKQYPEDIRQFEFHFESAIRGSVVDSKNGNILKLNRFGAIRKSYHGTQLIQYEEQKQIYRSTYVDLNDTNYIAIDTSFSIAFCVLFGQIIGFKDKHPGALASYEAIAADILYSVDQVHANGRLKHYIGQHLEDYVIQDQRVVDGLRRYQVHGKKIFIATNSDYTYTRLLLDYAITPFLNPGEHWQSLFEYVITLSNKPRFFYDNRQFLKVDPANGRMSNLEGKIKPGIYQGGNAKQFTDDLALNGDEILYIGDHIYGDILRLKKDCNWRTALVVEELKAEIRAQVKALPVDQAIQNRMLVKEELEHTYAALQANTVLNQTPEEEASRHALHQKILEVDQEVAALLEKENTFFNPIWGRIFRAGAEESYFAYQVERYACIYMEQLADLLEQSPLTYFRAHRRMLPHDHL